MDPKERHNVLGALGFRLLDFPYVQPALSEEQGKCLDLLLGVHYSFLHAPPAGLKPGEGGAIDAKIALNFMAEFFAVLMGPESLIRDEDYLKIVEFVKTHDELTVIPPGSR